MVDVLELVLSMTFTAEQKLKAIEREINYRRHVYPRLVDSGKKTAQEAANGVAIMEEIRDDYAKLAENDRLL